MRSCLPTSGDRWAPISWVFALPFTRRADMVASDVSCGVSAWVAGAAVSRRLFLRTDRSGLVFAIAIVLYLYSRITLEPDSFGDFLHQRTDLIGSGAVRFVFDDALPHGHGVLIGDPIVEHRRCCLQAIAVRDHLARLRFDLGAGYRWRPADDHQCRCL